MEASRLKDSLVIIAECMIVFSFQGTEEWKCSNKVGVDWGVGPPVPIPNTEVKHTFADNTCRVTGREDR